MARPKETRPAVTDTAAPDKEPPETCLELKTLHGIPYGERVPLRPVAN
jgi:hypothetical protein